MENKKFEFDTVIRKNPNLNAGFIEFPYDVKKEFGKSRVKVKALINGIPYRGSLVKMGGECHWMGITQEMRKATGKNPGDTIHVVIEEDKEERTVEIPDDLRDLLEKEPTILEHFNNLAFTHRKEYVRWIVEARRAETRKSRLERAFSMLKNDMIKKGK